VNGVRTALPRDERRKRTEIAILDAARELFAETGFERTTIRGVASRAGIDPALVMQYYGNKERLFAEASRWRRDDKRIDRVSVADLPAAALQDLVAHFEHPQDGEAAKALMRNCLTHPSAADAMRDKVMCDRAASVAAKLDGPDAELRAALFGACMMGIGMARYLIELPHLADASPEDLERLLGPALAALLEPPEY
jgi:AcrR family transcriptional regulator